MIGKADKDHTVKNTKHMHTFSKLAKGALAVGVAIGGGAMTQGMDVFAAETDEYTLEQEGQNEAVIELRPATEAQEQPQSEAVQEPATEAQEQPQSEAVQEPASEEESTVSELASDSSEESVLSEEPAEELASESDLSSQPESAKESTEAPDSESEPASAMESSSESDLESERASTTESVSDSAFESASVTESASDSASVDVSESESVSESGSVQEEGYESVMDSASLSESSSVFTSESESGAESTVDSELAHVSLLQSIKKMFAAGNGTVMLSSLQEDVKPTEMTAEDFLNCISEAVGKYNIYGDKIVVNDHIQSNLAGNQIEYNKDELGADTDYDKSYQSVYIGDLSGSGNRIMPGTATDKLIFSNAKVTVNGVERNKFEYYVNNDETKKEYITSYVDESNQVKTAPDGYVYVFQYDENGKRKAYEVQINAVAGKNLEFMSGDTPIQMEKVTENASGLHNVSSNTNLVSGSDQKTSVSVSPEQGNVSVADISFAKDQYGNVTGSYEGMAQQTQNVFGNGNLRIDFQTDADGNILKEADGVEHLAGVAGRDVGALADVSADGDEDGVEITLPLLGQ